MAAEMASDQVVLSAAGTTVNSAVSAEHWSLVQRVAFRLCFVYFGLYVLSNQMLGGVLPFGGFITPFEEWKPVQAAMAWIAKHVFHISKALVLRETGSGDRTVDWLLNGCILLVAILAAVVWSLADRKSESYPRMYKWFRVFIRFALAAQLLGYGFSKAFPLQMPFPGLDTLLEPYGNFSPMGVLWSSIGASTAYEIFAGCAEALGGLLLIFPRTTTFGALICLADMTQVFLLNMTYDVPVKLLSFNLILFSLFLLADDGQRLANLFFLNRPVPAAKPRPLFRRLWANRVALAVQIAFGGLLVGQNIYGELQQASEYGWKVKKPALYGIWDVQDFSIDGQQRPPLLTDTERWRRVTIDSFEADAPYATIHGMDDAAHGYRVQINSDAQTMVFTKYNDKNWKANFTFERPTPTELILDGTLDNHKIHARLEAFDLAKFNLVSRGFHWIQEINFNR